MRTALECIDEQLLNVYYYLHVHYDAVERYHQLTHYVPRSLKVEVALIRLSCNSRSSFVVIVMELSAQLLQDSSLVCCILNASTLAIHKACVLQGVSVALYCLNV